MKRVFTAVAVLAAATLVLMSPASATPQQDRLANCEAIGGVYDEGASSSHNTATCTVTTTEVVTTTEQVNNIRAAKQVLRTTSTEITTQTVYAFTNQGGGSLPTNGVEGDPVEGEAVMVQCTPGSGYDACPDND